MKKKYKLFLSIILSIILIFVLIRANSFALALMRSGLSTFGYGTIVHSINSSTECEYMVINTSTDKHDIVLVHLQKNNYTLLESDELTDIKELVKQ